jgi:hypothetical protein
MVLVAVFFTTAGCASIIKGRMQELAIQSSPDGASVTVFDKDGMRVTSASTPCKVSLKRGMGYFKKGAYRVVVEKEGYAPFEMQVEGRLNGWYLGGNLLVGGLIGYLIVDPITGGMWTLAPEDVSATLSQKSALFSPEKDTFVIMLKEQVPAELIPHMLKVEALMAPAAYATR